ncbi:MAG: shikimate kinase AroK [Pseudomonadota bacterium]
MSMPQSLFLIGPMGAGKTTIGRLLSQQLGLSFVDSDHYIEERTGVSIPTIFEYEGEAGFRQREARAIDELSRRQGIVLATGGGAVTTEKNRLNLAARGLVLYLKTSIDEQLKRAGNDKNRPLMQTPDPREKLKAMAEQRNPLYQQIADHTFDTDNRTARQVVKSILSSIEEKRENTQG